MTNLTDALVLNFGTIDDQLYTAMVFAGTGCMSTSLISCFAAVTGDYFSAAVAEMPVMCLSGERAKKQVQE